MRNGTAKFFLPLAMLSFAVMANTAAASTIDFNGQTQNTAISPPTYGSAGNVTVTWSNVCEWNTGYGDLLNVGFAANSGCGSSGAIGHITFTANPGFAVSLSDFDVAGYFDGTSYWGAGNHRVTVSGDATYDSGLFTILQGSHVNLAPGLVSNLGGSLTLNFDLGAASSNIWYLGIDNIHFGETTGIAAIPEPASLLLLGTGLAVAARRRLRRKA